jgi:hypothetical protein
LRVRGRAVLCCRSGDKYEPQGDQDSRSRAHAET